MGNITEGPIDELKDAAMKADKNELEAVLSKCLVQHPDDEESPVLSEEEFKEYGAIFAHQFEIDMSKSGFDTLSKRNE